MPPSRRREKLLNRVASCPASRSDSEQGLWLKRATSDRLGEGQLSTLPRHWVARAGMAVEGHEDVFPLNRLNAGCPFSQRTSAPVHGNGRDAPFADAPRSGSDGLGGP